MVKHISATFVALMVVAGLVGCASSGPVVYINEEAAQETAVSVLSGESLMAFGFRIKDSYKFQRVLFDISYSGTPIAYKARRVVISNGADLSSAFDVPGLRAYQIPDAGGHSLVLTDSGYEDWQRLRVFDVEEGTLKKNAQRLAESLGWSLDDGDWKTNDFATRAFPLVVSDDPQQAIGKLLKQYPTAAELNPNNLTVKVMPRLDALN